ncbi:MAG: hypothetical protein AAGA69_08790 [Pseudomonadota bacterium]
MIKKAFFEAAFVVFGVVLALAANGWREARADQAEAAAAHLAIQQEIQDNRDAVAQAVAAHDVRLEAIGNPQDSAPVDMRAFRDGFIRPASTLSKAAWNSASETGALAHMEFETVRELGALYAYQDRYSQQVTSYSSLIYETLFEQGYQGIISNKAGMISMISTLRYQEAALVEVYDGYLMPLTASDN